MPLSSSSASRTASGAMPPFGGQLNEKQIQDVAAYVVASTQRQEGLAKHRLSRRAALGVPMLCPQSRR